MAVVFGDIVSIVVTQTVATSTGRNGSTVTFTLPETVTTSVVETTGKLTFTTGETASPAPTGPAVTGGSGAVVTINGLPLFVYHL